MTFTCKRCNPTFTKSRSDEEAKAEFNKAPWCVPGNDFGIICEDCFVEFKAWFETLTDEDHKTLRMPK